MHYFKYDIFSLFSLHCCLKFCEKSVQKLFNATEVSAKKIGRHFQSCLTHIHFCKIFEDLYNLYNTYNKSLDKLTAVVVKMKLKDCWIILSAEYHESNDWPSVCCQSKVWEAHRHALEEVIWFVYVCHEDGVKTSCSNEPKKSKKGETKLKARSIKHFETKGHHNFVFYFIFCSSNLWRISLPGHTTTPRMIGYCFFRYW